MPGQYPDKKTVGIPPDIVLVRHQTEAFMAQAASSAMSADTSAQASSASAQQSAQHADEAHQYAEDAKGWSERNSHGIHFGPSEPAEDQRYDGMLWLKTNEAARTITQVNRFDASDAGLGTYVSESLYVSDELYLNDSGAWTSFTFDL